MAKTSPSTRIEESLRERELVDKQGAIEENLLRTMEKQAQVLSNQLTKLKQISLQKQLQKE